MSSASTSVPPLLAVENLGVDFLIRSRRALLPWISQERLRAVEDVSLTVARGETLGIVGESGSGKTTLGRAIVGLTPISAGGILFDGLDTQGLTGTAARDLRRRVQFVFQDPGASLNPRLRIDKILGEPIDNFELAQSTAIRREMVEQALIRVGLPPSFADRYPHQLSGGQRQRVAITRALLSGPELIICDEPVAALDVSVRAQLLNLLVQLQQVTAISMIFIGHDIATVEFMSDRIAVMYRGRILEIGTAAAIVLKPQHPYTRMLIESVPVPIPGSRSRGADDAMRPAQDQATACGYAHLCPLANDRCRSERPKLRPLGHHRYVACHLAG